MTNSPPNQIPIDFTFSDKTCVYFVLFSPIKAIAEQVAELKRNASRFLNDDRHIRILPHITITQFLMSERHEVPLCKSVKQFAEALKGTKLTVDNLTIFDNLMPTLCLSIKETQEVKKMIEQLRVEILINGFVQKPNAIKLITKLHISIARRMRKQEDTAGVYNYLQPRLPAFPSFDFNVVLLKSNADATGWEKVRSF